MEMTEEQISEIAELLQGGLICFHHRSTGSLEWHPDPDSPYFDPEPWEDLIDKIENDRDSYMRFEIMDSYQAFKLMENFAYSLSDINFRDKILERLSRRKPFHHFKVLIDYSPYRQAWFDFRQQSYIDWVKKQLTPGEQEP